LTQMAYPSALEVYDLSKLLVVKYGGSVLDGGSTIRKAAETVKEELERGNRLVLVVSAMKGVTDQLLSAAKEIGPGTPREVIDQIIGLGEEQSVRLMASALKSLGVDAVEVTPHSPSWPIITNEDYGNAEPIIKECIIGTELGVSPLIRRGQVPVICGFVGKSLNGNITTLGRGGSDTTATLLARFLDADELILVKDVGGVYTADPGRVGDARLIEEISACEANLLASSGAKVLHDKVFRYKPEDLKIRLVSCEQTLNGSGTVVTGNIPELEIEVHEKKVVKLVLLGDAASEPDTLVAVTEAILKSGGTILNIKASGESTSIYVNGGLGAVLREVHTIVESKDRLKSVTGTDDLGLIRVWGQALSDPLTNVEWICNVLSSKGILVHDLAFGESSVTVLVDWERRAEALDHLYKYWSEEVE
jgi:aspartate kinase